MDHILEPHFEATVDRCRPEPVIGAVQDTPTANDTGLTTTEGLDELRGDSSSSPRSAEVDTRAIRNGGTAPGKSC